MVGRGLPHSEIPGSKLVCSSPRLIAACHVLHRLLAPRHPPCALSSLTGKLRSFPWCLTNLNSLAPGTLGPKADGTMEPCLPKSQIFGCQRAFRRDPPPGRWREVFKTVYPTGGDNRDRTGNLRLAKPALSQLSYIPKPVKACRVTAWWAWVDLNYRPHAYQACALTN